MMALLVKRYYLQYPNENSFEAAKYYAYTLAKPHVPDHLSTQFDTLFKPEQSISRSQDKKPQQFTLTSSNQPAIDTLNDFLTLRSLRQEDKIPAQGGLGGLILEGEPGIGKTELVAKTLVAHGLKRKKINNTSDGPGFYIMPVSMPLSEKENLLRRAFHEGSIVVIDEINSAPMMEELLNELLDPKKSNAAKNPGFMVIGTQNPPTMAGRRRASTALEHRLYTVKLPEYSRNEMVLILSNKGLPDEISQSMVDEYLKLREKTDQNNQAPLCFRDLLKRVEEYLRSEKKHLGQDIELLDNQSNEKQMQKLKSESELKSEPELKTQLELQTELELKTQLELQTELELNKKLFNFEHHPAPNKKRIELMKQLLINNGNNKEFLTNCYDKYKFAYQNSIKINNKSQLFAISHELKEIHSLQHPKK